VIRIVQLNLWSKSTGKTSTRAINPLDLD
jgi:hypothetical protein